MKSYHDILLPVHEQSVNEPDSGGAGLVAPPRGELLASSARGRASQPPITDRGVEPSHKEEKITDVVSIDWLTVTIHAAFEDVQDYIAMLGFAEGLTDTGHGAAGFRTLHEGLLGFKVASNPVTDTGKTWTTISIPGQACRYAGTVRLQRLLSWLSVEDWRWNVSRLDIACDTRAFEVSDFVTAFESGQVVTKAKKWAEERSNDAKGGHTFYLGGRSSTAMLRVYRKADSRLAGSSEPFTRVELQLRDERALSAFMQIFAFGLADIPGQAAELVMGFLDVETDWWREWTAGLKRAWLKLRENVPTVEKMRDWVMRQVAPTLAAVSMALSGGETVLIDEFMREIAAEGLGRMSARKKAAVRWFLEASVVDDYLQGVAAF